MFKDNYVSITIQCNLKIFNYLNVTFNLSNATYQPFCNRFNSPYSKIVLTKVGNQFLKLNNSLIPRHHKFYKLFTKNNAKVSYSCMPNMKNKMHETKNNLHSKNK